MWTPGSAWENLKAMIRPVSKLVATMHPGVEGGGRDIGLTGSVAAAEVLGVPADAGETSKYQSDVSMSKIGMWCLLTAWQTAHSSN